MKRVVATVANAVRILMVVALAILAVWFLYARIRMAQTETMPRIEAAPSGEIRFRAHDVDIQLREWGSRNGKPLLPVHGIGAWSGTWVSNVEAMAAAGFRVVAMDLPPFGFSDLPANGDYTRKTQARRTLAVTNQVGAQPVTLLGHSFGGGPAAEAAMLDPARVSHLILLDAAIGLQDAPPAATCSPPLPVQLLMGGIGTPTA